MFTFAVGCKAFLAAWTVVNACGLLRRTIYK